MANIDIERKSSMAWVWWAIGLLALLLIAWVWLADGDDDEVAMEDEVAVLEAPAGVTPATVPAAGGAMGPEAGAAAASMPAVQEYLSTCAPREPRSMGLDHAYTSDCIRRLVGSMEALLATPALSGVDAASQMADARQAADRLASSATGAEHSRMTREAFVSLAALANRVQDQRFPALDGTATQLEQTAQSMNAATPLLDQREAVQRYFAEAGELLNGMAGAG